MNRLKMFSLILVLGVFTQWMGGTTNRVVMEVNHGKMPVWYPSHDLMLEVADQRHTPYTRTSHLFLLCDIIPEPVFMADGDFSLSLLSIGDVLLYGGKTLYALSVLALFWGLRKKRKFTQEEMYLWV